MGIIVNSVSKPTAQLGWRWSLLQTEDAKTVLLETNINGCQLFRVERTEHELTRVLIDDAFALHISASIFDAIGTMECRIKKPEFVQAVTIL